MDGQESTGHGGIGRHDTRRFAPRGSSSCPKSSTKIIIIVPSVGFLIHRWYQIAPVTDAHIISPDDVMHHGTAIMLVPVRAPALLALS